MSTYKIAFLGEPGAGKTTCIAALSQITPVSTDVGCFGELSKLKPTTTVALDYGELDIGSGTRLLLYGMPGQARFSYMFDVVREGLLGAVILVDGESDGAAQGLAETLDTYAAELRKLPHVIAINKNAAPRDELRHQCQALLVRHGLVAPIVVVDARRRDEIVDLLQLLLSILEYGFDATEQHEEFSAWQ